MRRVPWLMNPPICTASSTHFPAFSLTHPCMPAATLGRLPDTNPGLYRNRKMYPITLEVRALGGHIGHSQSQWGVAWGGSELRALLSSWDERWVPCHQMHGQLLAALPAMQEPGMLLLRIDAPIYFANVQAGCFIIVKGMLAVQGAAFAHGALSGSRTLGELFRFRH